jgi:class 3 adenylate cyclase
LVPLLAAQSEIGIAAGDPDQARWAADELERVAAVFGSKGLLAEATTARGMVEMAEGGHAAARESLQAGVRLWQEVGAPYEAAKARVGWASALRASGSAEKATLELRAARTVFERLGARPDAERAARELGEAGANGASRTAREEKVFMFTDIVKSTNLVELIGDEDWGHLVRWHNDTISRLVRDHGGTVVRTTGDGFFVTFDSSGRAVECAVTIQRALESHRKEHGFSPWVRIGMHRAEATRDGSDWRGVGVHAAARVGALADRQEILASRETAASAGTGYPVSEPRSVSLKGISQPLEVVAIDWR